MDDHLLAKMAGSQVPAGPSIAGPSNHWLMWRIKNDVVFIMTLVQQQPNQRGVAAVGTSALKLYRILGLLMQSIEVALSQDRQVYNQYIQSIHCLSVGTDDAATADIDSPFSASSQSQQSYLHFNQDTIRDNFSAITLLIDQVFDGIGCPGGAIPNMLISSPSNANYMITDMLKKGINQNNVAQDMIQGQT